MASAPPRGSMSQDWVFYTKEWTREVDGVFIRSLTEQTTQFNLVFHGEPNRNSILVARSRVNRQFGKSFDYDFCLDRLHKLYKRFLIFNWIIQQPGVLHYPLNHSIECDDALNHSIECDDAAWGAICRHDALGLAYMRKGEEEFDNLQFIFTAEHNSDSGEDEREIINLSSDPDKMSLSSDDIDTDHANAFSYELAWYTSPSRTDNTSSSSGFSSFSGASSTAHKRSVKRLSTKHPLCPRVPTGSGPTYVASSSPLKK